MNNPDIYPSIAALYWIGQSFTLFVTVIDMMVLQLNSKVDHYTALEPYQVKFVWIITAIENLALLLSFSLAFIPLFSHSKKPISKKAFELYYTLIF